jgi:hypothetical protein
MQTSPRGDRVGAILRLDDQRADVVRLERHALQAPSDGRMSDGA